MQTCLTVSTGPGFRLTFRFDVMSPSLENLTSSAVGSQEIAETGFTFVGHFGVCVYAWVYTVQYACMSVRDRVSRDSGSLLLLLPGFWISQAGSACSDSFLSLSAYSLCH